MIRINKFLSDSGLASRRQADKLIASSQILVNGKVATLGQKIDPLLDQVVFNQKVIKLFVTSNLVYLILNKPTGFVTTTATFQNQHSVMELINIPERVFPVGRLDQDTTGLLLFTNDGDLANLLTHPRHHLPKTYLVEIIGRDISEKIHQLEQGVKLDDGFTLPAIVKLISTNPRESVLEITLYQGKKRQIRRMCASLHLHVVSLHRTSVGPLKIGNLKLGCCRHLTPVEIDSLKNRV